MTKPVSDKPIPNTRDPLWPLSDSLTVALALIVLPHVAFLLGWIARGGCQ